MSAYRDALRRLAALDAEAATLRAEADRWYADRSAAVDRALSAADDAVQAAAADVERARRDVDDVDARAAGLWSEYVHRIGPTAERFGRGVPEPVVPRQRDGRPVAEYLRDVEVRVAYTPPPRSVPSAVFAVLGALGGALGFGIWSGLRWLGTSAGGDLAVGLPVLAVLLALVGPMLGIGAAKLVADRRGAALDSSTVALALGAALATAAVLYAATR